MTVRTWLDACRDFAAAHGLQDDVLELLRAFANPWPRGGPQASAEPAWAGEFAALERVLVDAPTFADLAGSLGHEVDAGQADMFARRVAAVDAVLGAYDDPLARLLRVGLRQRLAGILVAARPRALRVRALADFYYSYACRSRALASPPRVVRTIAELVTDADLHDVAPGLAHATIAGDGEDGPVHVNILYVDPRRIAIGVLDCRADAEAGVPFADTVANSGALAATSGGYFLYSEPDIVAPSRRHDPVGMLVQDGVVRQPPVFARGALVVDADGGVTIERVGLVGATIRIGTRRIIVERVTHRAHAERGPVRPSAAVLGDRVLAVGTSLPVPLAGAVVEPCDGLAAGDTIVWELPPLASGAAIHAAIAGGPVLLERGQPVHDLRREDFWGTAPPVTFSQDETGDRNLLPRLAVGLRVTGELLFVAVDGRNFERALGMTLGQVADLMRALECVDAVNLDGGSSKRMVLAGRTLDLPSTEVVGAPATDPAVRPVYTAITLRPR